MHPFRSGLGVFESAIAAAYRAGEAPPPYVPRDVDSWLDEALATSLFVLVTGSSGAGKSRTTFAAATRMEPEPLLLVPASPRALPHLFTSDEVIGDGRPALLWLDDLARYLTVPGVRPALFESLSARAGAKGQTVVVLATLNLTESGALLSATGEIGRSMREILGSAFEVTVPSEMSPAERERAARLYPGQELSRGIGQHFASTGAVVNRFRDELRDDPRTASVVAAALDWRRAGAPRPVTEDELGELSTMYLRPSPAAEDDPQAAFGGALARARERAESNAALLMPPEVGTEGSWEINGAVREWVDRGGPDVDAALRTIPEATWAYVLGRADGEDAFEIGVAAHIRGYPAAAVNAWTKAAAEASPATSCRARLHLGLALLASGRHTEALESLDAALDGCGQEPDAALADVVAAALFHRGLALRGLGRPLDEVAAWEAFLSAYGAAPTPRERERVATALLRKGEVLASLDRKPQALEAFDAGLSLLADAPEPPPDELVAQAYAGKGAAARAMGSTDEALAAYEAAIAHFEGHEGTAPREIVATSLFDRGEVLAGLGRSEEALQSFDGVLARVGPEAAASLRELRARSLSGKGLMLTALGRSSDAVAAYDQVVTEFSGTSDPSLGELVARSLFNRGAAMAAMGRPEEALGAFDEVVRRFRPEAALKAPGTSEVEEDSLGAVQAPVATSLFNRAVALGALGRTQDALDAYEEFVAHYGGSSETAVRELVARALVGRAQGLAALGRSDDALSAYNEVLARFDASSETGLQELVAKSLVGAGVALSALGRPGDAIGAYDKVVARFGTSGGRVTEWVAKALADKAAVLSAQGRVLTALRAYEEILSRFGTAPREASSEAPGAALQEQVANALVHKGLLLSSVDRPDEALEAYDDLLARFGQATEAPLHEHVARALVAKGEILAQVGRGKEALETYQEIQSRFEEAE
ncbi:MAG TPA: tetratricopeptide repeat protein, partial [Actinomycetota bacterium]